MAKTKNHKSLLSLFILLVCLPFLIFAIAQIITLQKKASGTLANIIVETQSLQGNLNPIWQNLAQGGEETKDMIGPYTKKIKDLNPKLIRIDHLFDFYNVYSEPGNYNFSQLDQTINNILKTGAVPMLSLSYTPQKLAKDGKSENEPTDWNEWYQLVKATAHHYSVEKNIQGIYYEVWNEPDLFGSWHYSKSPSYTNLYIQTTKAVTEGAAGSNFKVGGPATTSYYSNWTKSLFKTAVESGIRLDFISWHKYSKNIQDYIDDFSQFRKDIDNYSQYSSIETIISESGPNSSPDSWYDNNLSAIHLISLASQLTGKINRVFTFEIADGPSSRSNDSTGWGILTHESKNSKEKPRFLALQFLNQLQGQRLSSGGDGTWVSSLSSKNNKTIQTVLVNYDPQNQHSEIVPINFKHLSPGNYKIKTTYFMGNTTTKNITVNSLRSYSDNIILEPNNAILIEITPSN